MRKNQKMSEEHKQKLRDSYYNNPKRQVMMHKTKGKITDESTKIKLRDSYYNNPKRQAMMQSDEYRQKMSKIKKGIKFSQEHKNKIALGRKNWLSKNKHTIMGINNPFYGKIPTQEHRDKVSKGNTGKVRSKEFIENIRLKNLGSNNPFYGKKHNQQLKDKISKLSKERRKHIVFPVKDTGIEVKIQNFLSELQIPYLKHKYMNQIEHGYQCDILIPALFMVIECDGNYWHNYPVGNDIDRIRTKELEEQTFRVIRLWESEINSMNIQEFKQKIGVNI